MDVPSELVEMEGGCSDDIGDSGSDGRNAGIPHVGITRFKLLEWLETGFLSNLSSSYGFKLRYAKKSLFQKLVHGSTQEEGHYTLIPSHTLGKLFVRLVLESYHKVSKELNRLESLINKGIAYQTPKLEARLLKNSR